MADQSENIDLALSLAVRYKYKLVIYNHRPFITYNLLWLLLVRLRTERTQKIDLKLKS